MPPLEAIQKTAHHNQDHSPLDLKDAFRQALLSAHQILYLFDRRIRKSCHQVIGQKSLNDRALVPVCREHIHGKKGHYQADLPRHVC